MINSILNNFETIMTNFKIIAPLLAFVAGIISSFNPCTLSMFPLIIGYVTSMEEIDSKKAFKLSSVFVIGSTIVFLTLGIIISILGKNINLSNDLWYMLLGMFLVIIALEVLEVTHLIPSSSLVNKNKSKGYLGIFIAGVLSALFASPCSTPVFILILGLVGTSGSLLYGILLLLLYSLGYGVIIIIAGVMTSKLNNVLVSDKSKKFSKVIRNAFGIMLLLFAAYMYYLGF